MLRLLCAVGIGLALSLGASLSVMPAWAAEASHAEDEPRPYDKDADARADVQLVLDDAKRFNKLGLIVMGANWCHDSRALASYFEKPRFQTLIEDHYRLVYVDVGFKDRNIDIAREFGVESIVGTPTVFITSPEGEVLNLETAPTWRHAASRGEDEAWEYFKSYTTQE